MVDRWQKRQQRRQRKRFPQVKTRREEFVLLDRFSVADIRKWKNLQEKILRHHWDLYSSLAYQRGKLADEIRQALLYASERAIPFKGWQRAVKYKYALEPLSMEGSLTDPGGRFNIGDIKPESFSPFPCLYIAEDKETALQELLCQKEDLLDSHKTLDLALTNPTSIVSVSVSGYLDSVINLREPGELVPFIDLIKNFHIPEHLKETAKEIGLAEPILIRTVPQLLDALLNPYWRSWPMQFDVPTASQFFGQLIVNAGIHGILYPSKFSGKNCLAIFPQTFIDSPSFIELDDATPPGIKINRLDANS